jgi:hypothetical protein
MNSRKRIIAALLGILYLGHVIVAVFMVITFEHHWPHMDDLPETAISRYLDGVEFTPRHFSGTISPVGNLSAVIIHKDGTKSTV